MWHNRLVEELVVLAAVVYIYAVLSDFTWPYLVIFAVAWAVIRTLTFLVMRRRQHPPTSR